MWSIPFCKMGIPVIMSQFPRTSASIKEDQDCDVPMQQLATDDLANQQPALTCLFKAFCCCLTLLHIFKRQLHNGICGKSREGKVETLDFRAFQVVENYRREKRQTDKSMSPTQTSKQNNLHLIVLKNWGKMGENVCLSIPICLILRIANQWSVSLPYQPAAFEKVLQNKRLIILV